MPKDLSDGYKISQEQLCREAVYFELDELLERNGWFVQIGEVINVRRATDGTCAFSMAYVVDFHRCTKYGAFFGFEYSRSWTRQFQTSEGPLWAADTESQLIIYSAPLVRKVLVLNMALVKASYKGLRPQVGFSRNRRGTDYTEKGLLLHWEHAENFAIISYELETAPDVMKIADTVF